MEYILICLLAFLGAGLTLFSGFGLGTLLVPVFAVYFPIDEAILLTAIVHFLNNFYKLGLLGKHIHLKIALQFGIPSIIAAFAGALLLSYLGKSPALFSYTLSEHSFEITPIKLIVGLLLIFFALVDIVPKLSQLSFNQKYLMAGGLLSGFFGGLSGHQGALRSAFLIRAGLSKESFIATGVIIACFIDVSRLLVYTQSILQTTSPLNYSLLLTATLAAFAGTYVGNKFIKKITIRTLQLVVAIAIISFGALMALGFI